VQFEGKATVRYCTKKGLSYVIGLQVEGQDAGGKFKTERLHA
jgi:hypothetical protein